MTESTKSSTFIHRLPTILLLAGIAILLIWIGLLAYRAYSLYGTVSELQAEAEKLAENGLSEMDIEYIGELTRDTRRDFVHLRNGLKPVLSVLPLLSWIPEVGPVLKITPELMKMGDAGTYAAVELIDGLGPALHIIRQQNSEDPLLVSSLLSKVEGADHEIANAIKATEALISARNGIDDTSQLPWRMRNLLELFDNNIELFEDGLRLSAVLPEIMGSDGRKTYLIMAQNEDEIRATGGFISGAGLLVVEDGQIISVSFDDANQVDDYLNKPYDFPPEPFYEIMGMDIFLFRDGNFWPDFPVSAEAVMDLYTLGRDVPLDGIIAIDQEFIKILLSATGPLFIPELETTLSTTNVIAEMRDQWNPDPGSEGGWINERKAFMGPMADALRGRIETSLSSLDIPALARSLAASAEQRHLQIYMRDPEAAEILAATGWDGHFENTYGQDYLLIVDMSLGFNKVSAIMEKEVSYSVTIPEAGNPSADLLVQYSHTGIPAGESCNHGTFYSLEMSYSDLFEDCYWNYVRIYAPLGTSLTGSSHNPVSSEQLLSGQAWEGYARESAEQSDKFQVFDAFYLVGQGESLDGQLFYSLPQEVIASTDGRFVYKLEVAKQAGVSPYLVTVRVVLPPGAQLVSASPNPTSTGNGEIVFRQILQNDSVFEVVYE